MDEIRKVYDWHRCDTRMTELKDVCCTANANWGTGGNNMPLVMTTEMTPKIDEKGIAFSMRSRDYKDPQSVLTEETFCIGNGQTAQTRLSENVGTLNCMHDQQAVMHQAIIRRLIPLECERLQGFPDNWTMIGDWVDSKGKKHKGDSDAPRYRALGNSIALPFWEWMAGRMIKQLKEDGVDQPTMASLFDGIGGFPLVYSRWGCVPVWASEIEEFPIAVTKVRFPEEGSKE